MKNVNIAIIGARFMGKAHSNAWGSAPKFFSLALSPVLKVACDLDPKETTDFARNWGWQEIETDWRKVVERKDVDVVDICTPTLLHQEIAIAAAQNGKHVLCEKPIATSIPDAKSMIEVCHAEGVLLQIPFVCRFYPTLQAAKRLGEEIQWPDQYSRAK